MYIKNRRNSAKYKGFQLMSNFVLNNRKIGASKSPTFHILTVKLRTIEKNGNVSKDIIWYNNELVLGKTDLNTLPIKITTRKCVG